MEDYYQILGIERNARQADIKRAYRKLVQQLHPDVNPDPSAMERIKQVNEAYEVLSNTTKRKAYDYRLENPYLINVEPEEPLHRDPAYRRGRYRPAQSEGPTQLDLMERAMPFLRGVAVAGCLIFFFLVVDFFLKPDQSTETITGFRTDELRLGWQDYLLTHTGREMKISPQEMLRLSVGDDLVFSKSKILGVVFRAQSRDGLFTFYNYGSLYGNFVFVPVLLLIGCVLLMTAAGNTEFRFSLGLVNVFMLIFTCILMSIS